jgi:cytochrome c556
MRSRRSYGLHVADLLVTQISDWSVDKMIRGSISFFVLGLAMMANSQLAKADGGGATIARQACMKASTSSFNAMLPIFKGEKPYDEAVVPRAMSNIDIACSDWEKFWPQDSKAVPGLNSRADAAIWSDPAGFRLSSDAYFAALKEFGNIHDEPSFKAKFFALGQACSACHQKYRTPEN